MKIDFLTLFPEMFNGVLNQSILKRAQDKNMLTVNTVDFRHFAENKHNQVDDYPFGGGQGMVLKPEPIFNAMKSIEKTDDTRVILMCPQGKPFTKGMSVPDVLLSGNHAHIDRWRHEQKILRTFVKRPDLLERYPMTVEEKDIVERYKKQLKKD